MLTLHTGSGARDCTGASRRDLLQAGFLGLGGLSLPWMMQARAAAGEAGFVRDKAVVLIYCSGGASHIETFNPNMGGPEASRSITGEVKTDLPGVTLGGTFPLLARHASRMAIVKSFRHPVGAHDQAISHILTGGTDTTGQKVSGFSMGSMFSRLRGANHPRTGLPTYHLVPDVHVDPQYRNEQARVVIGSRPGPLGAAFAPFVPAGKGPAMQNLKLHIPGDRLGDRRQLLKRLDALRHGLDEGDTRGGLGQFEQQAVELLTGGAARAFDLSQEKPATRERYDTSSFKTGKKKFQPSILGKQFLMARRLIEAGAGFVTLQSAGWDMHADGNNPGIKSGMEMLGRPLDKALSAFLSDLKDRGLEDKVLVVLTGDFGRTPRINKKGGRDHWTSLCTLALWGGGLKMGQVVGTCDRGNARPTSTPYNTSNLLSTVMHTLFDLGVMRVSRAAPSSLVKLVEDNKPIAELF